VWLLPNITVYCTQIFAVSNVPLPCRYILYLLHIESMKAMLPTMFATGIYHDMFPQYVWTITPTHDLLVALNCAH
jgi:hypothetical protein